MSQVQILPPQPNNAANSMSRPRSSFQAFSAIEAALIARIRLRGQPEHFPGFAVHLPDLAGRGQSLVEINLSLVQPIRERRRFVVTSVPEIIEQHSDQFATALNFLLVS